MNINLVIVNDFRRRRHYLTVGHDVIAKMFGMILPLTYRDRSFGHILPNPIPDPVRHLEIVEIDHHVGVVTDAWLVGSRAAASYHGGYRLRQCSSPFQSKQTHALA